MSETKKMPGSSVINSGMIGLRLLSIFDKNNRKLTSAVIRGKHDVSLKAAFLLMNHGVNKSHYSMSAQEVSYLEAFKSHLDKPEIYKDFAIPFDKANDTIRAIQALQANALGLMKGMNSSHPEGSTSELANKYGVSMSEIRRRRSNNTLNEFIQLRKKSMSEVSPT